MVESPYQEGKYVEATKNVRGSWSLVLRERGHINAAQEKTGDRFRFLWEKRILNMAVDPNGVPVKKHTTSRHTPHRMLTAWELAKLRCRLGRREEIRRRLRRKRYVAFGVRVKLKTNEFRILTRQNQRQQPTDVAEELYADASIVLDEFEHPGPFCLVGMTAYDLVTVDETAQLNLFVSGVQ